MVAPWWIAPNFFRPITAFSPSTLSTVDKYKGFEPPKPEDDNCNVCRNNGKLATVCAKFSRKLKSNVYFAYHHSNQMSIARVLWRQHFETPCETNQPTNKQTNKQNSV
jgi:hypothetical protein